MTHQEMFEWFASALLLIQFYLYGEKTFWGPVFGAFVTVVWGYWGIVLHSPALVTVNVIICCIHLRNAYKWYSPKPVPFHKLGHRQVGEK